MRNRIFGAAVVTSLLLSALVCAGCNKQPQPAGKDAGKARPQPLAQEASKAQAPASVAVVARLRSQPSDEEIIKAIDDSGIMKRADGSFTVVPPVKIVEKGKLTKSGSWPVKVRFTLNVKTKDGKTAPPVETTSLFKVVAAKDSSGNSVWKAQLGS